MLVAVAVCARADWTPVGEGIDYQKFALPDPNNVYVARMLKSHAEATIESSMPKGTVAGARETIRAQSERLNGAINAWGHEWGQQNEVVVAINGDWIYPKTGMLYGGQVHSGWYAKRIFCEFGGTQFAWTYSREAFVGGFLNQATQEISITCRSTGAVLSAHGVNRPRGTDELIIYTSQFGDNTKTDASGVELVVEMTQPMGISPLPKMAVGTVRKILTDQGATPIPFDHIILSASGSATSALLANASVGSEIGVSVDVTAQEMPRFDWSDTYTSISGGRALVQNGVAVDNSSDHVYASRHPRTAVAYNDTHVFFVVCDGRSAESRGMSSQELSNFLMSTLGVTNALNLDGGGSSTMVVKGTVVNVPSDGSERAVGNGLMMVNLKPKTQSQTFQTGQRIAAASGVDVRLGPGTNYGSLKTLTETTLVTVEPHSLNGIHATADHWWKVDCQDVVGWLRETGLTATGD